MNYRLKADKILVQSDNISPLTAKTSCNYVVVLDYAKVSYCVKSFKDWLYRPVLGKRILCLNFGLHRRLKKK